MKYDAMTVLEVGAEGRLGRRAFTLVGRVCLKNAVGGVWNEFAVVFADGGRATLSEAAGTFALFDEGALAPSFDGVTVGEPLPAAGTVVEKGTATRVGAWGDVPDGPRSYRYVDVSLGAEGVATVDYGQDPPRSYVGRRIRLADLRLQPRAEAPRFIAVAPGRAPKTFRPCFDLGDAGTLDGVRYVVRGRMHRAARSEGETFRWDEYLLHSSTEGFRWLVVSDGHFSLVEPVAAGAVVITARGARYDGVSFAPLSSGTARVVWADGEFPWEVAVGDKVRTADWVSAPWMLSRETAGDEVVWSRGRYLPTNTIAKAFGKRVLPKPEGRAPHQPTSVSYPRSPN